MGYFPAMLRTGTDSTGMLQDYTIHRRFSVEADGIAKTSISAFCTVVKWGLSYSSFWKWVWFCLVS